MEKGFKQFLGKTGIFIFFFILFSLIVGKNLYTSKLLYDFGIYIYGRVGYILLFSIAGFILLYRERLLKIKSFGYGLKNLGFILISLVSLLMFYWIQINIEEIPLNLFSIILVNLLGISIFLFLGIGIYGWKFSISFFREFRKEIFYFLLFGLVMASLMESVLKLWPFFSGMVLKGTSFLLNAVNANFRIVPPDVIFVRSFGAKIAEACSGVYSIFIFISLYLFIVLLDWNKIDKLRALIIFFPAIIGAFFMNILRVFILFLIGGYFSSEIAMGLYHSYTGMIFFLVYFAVFWAIFYSWIGKEKKESRILALYRKVMKDSLYKNSVFLMLSTLIMSFFGFVFWIVCARLFSASDIGLATTIISIMALIVSISVLGLNSGLIRYLPTSDRKNSKINTVLTFVSLFSIVISVIFLLFVKFFSPRLFFIKENMFLSFAFIFFMICASISSVVESVFVALRKTQFVLIKNSIFSLTKIGFPFLLVGLGAYGIFGSWMLAMISGLLFSFIVLFRNFGYVPKLVFYEEIVKKMGKYSFGNYIAGLIGGLPTMLLPLLITNYLMPEVTAYYYISMMIASLLFSVSASTSNSLFAEGSSGENLKNSVKKSIKIILPLFLIGGTLLIVLGKYVLLVFGKEYSVEGLRFLQILIISGIFVSANSIFASVFKVQNRIREMVIRSVIGSVLIIVLSLMFMAKGFGLLGVGYAWIIGQALITLTYFILWKR
jgi:exosortase/archaeosortase family protein